MRLLFVLEHYHPFIGGAEVLFKNLCEGLAGRGHEVTVLTSLLPGTIPEENINGVAVRRVKLPKKGSRYWFSFVAITQSIKLAGQVDFIHTTTYNGAFPAWLAALWYKKKCMITVHEIIGDGWTEMMGMNWVAACVHRVLERVIVSLPFNIYVSVSAYTAGRLQDYGIRPDKIKVIHNGIDYDLFNPTLRTGAKIRKKLQLGTRFIYMYFGRPGISKGVEFLIKAVPLISASLPNSKLLLILSKRPEKGYRMIQALIKSMAIDQTIVQVEPVPRVELPDYIAAADCVVIPSLSEGFGFSAAESCAMGKTVVVSDVASLPEVVSGKYLLVQSKNPQAIADGLISIYNGEVESKGIRTFKWEDCVTGYEKIYSNFSGAAKKRNDNEFRD